MGETVRQHFVPKVYLRNWENEDGQLWVYDLIERSVAKRKNESALYLNHLYSVTLHEFRYFDPMQKIEFISPLLKYSIYLDGKKLLPKEVVDNLINYKDFVLIDRNGKVLKSKEKKHVLDLFFNRKDRMIEKGYSKIESKWSDVAKFFEGIRILTFVNGRLEPMYLPPAAQVIKICNDLLEFVLSMYTRNPYKMLYHFSRYNKQAEKPASAMEQRTAFEAIQLAYLSGKRKLFDTKKYELRCIFSTPGTYFYTSDNPVLLKGIKYENIGFTGIFWFPVTPNVLIALTERTASDKMTLFSYIAPPNAVNELNEYICNNAHHIVISHVDIHDNWYQHKM